MTNNDISNARAKGSGGVLPRTKILKPNGFLRIVKYKLAPEESLKLRELRWLLNIIPLALYGYVQGLFYIMKCFLTSKFTYLKGRKVFYESSVLSK